MLIKCSECGFINRNNASFCMKCGNNLNEENNTSNTPQSDFEWFLERIYNDELNLPSNDCPVILKRSEEPIVVLPDITLKEPRAIRTSYGGYGGPTIRISKGISFRLGGASSRSTSHDEITNIDKGTLTITNKRLVYTGSQKTLNYNLSKILSITEYEDAITIQRENKQKAEIFTNCDNLKLESKLNGQIKSIPFYGCLLKAIIMKQIQ